MKEKEFKKLLKKYNSGKVSHKEKALLDAFSDHFIHKNKPVFEGELHKKQVHADIYKGVKRNIRSKGVNWYSIAASIIVILGISLISWFAFTGENTSYTTVVTKDNEIKEITLTDGSIVTLNRNSILEFPEEFSKDKRQVKLTGEAFFKVEKDKNRPFRVTSNEVMTTVLGTQFNIYSSKKEVSVSLVEGLVDVKGLGASKILKPKQKISFDLTNKKITTETFDPKNELLWMSDNLSFDNTSLKEIGEVLEKKFGVSIMFSTSEMENVRVSGTFKNQSLTSILLAVTETINLKYKRTLKNQILIYNPQQDNENIKE
ncbi:FecR family protein [Galbibacter sp. EGI 63066]|uniref:FecR family protein n=1 Tax=Galbibacter sp. EGI 63066 TaxID=2993559 RepID=UPI0022487FD9|nr:FecR family protein [Galbibacter sp. EGI 63066]MCX2679154.1 FecR family protein [Galbibacter sp. EGI 63066]